MRRLDFLPSGRLKWQDMNFGSGNVLYVNVSTAFLFDFIGCAGETEGWFAHFYRSYDDVWPTRLGNFRYWPSKKQDQMQGKSIPHEAIF